VVPKKTQTSLVNLKLKNTNKTTEADSKSRTACTFILAHVL